MRWIVRRLFSSGCVLLLAVGCSWLRAWVIELVSEPMQSFCFPLLFGEEPGSEQDRVHSTLKNTSALSTLAQ
jgi:hypothetical protein